MQKIITQKNSLTQDIFVLVQASGGDDDITELFFFILGKKDKKEIKCKNH